MDLVECVRSSGGAWKRDGAALARQADFAGGARGIGVLIVEDEWLIAAEIETTLQDAGYSVVGIATTAEAAVRAAEAHRPDLILMDIRLQGERDGIQAALEIYERLGLRCLFASAHADASFRKRSDAAHPVGWLTKPFSPDQLLAAVRSALDQDTD